jgi:hypothetical protein
MAAATAAHGQAAGSRDGARYSDTWGCAGRERRRQQILDRRFPEITATRGYLQKHAQADEAAAAACLRDLTSYPPLQQN